MEMENRIKKVSGNRAGVAMIELIFAIVVMGFAISVIPVLVNRSTESIYTSLQQESIAAVATEMGTLFSTQWDDGDTNLTEGVPVLNTGSAAIASCAGSKPPGVSSNTGRYCTGLSSVGTHFSASATFGTDNSQLEAMGYYDDVDDYNNQQVNVTIYASESTMTEIGDYIDVNVTIIPRIYYGDDTPRNAAGGAGNYQRQTTFSNPFRLATAGTTTNIKLIRVTLTSNNQASELSNKQISMSAFMCNTGAPKQIVTNDPNP
jgi:hypothetical protein